MLALNTLDEAEAFVSNQQSLGNDVAWDGWEIVFFTPAAKAFYSTQGAFKGGSWGFENRCSVSEKGAWVVDARNVRSPRDSRS